MNYEHRKSTNRIKLLNNDGSPVSKKEIKYELKNHEFLFGCGAFDSMELMARDDSDKDKAMYQDRVNKWLDAFNYGTMSFYWGAFEPVEGKPQTENRMAATKYLVDGGAKIKGHPLCWHTVCANWLMQYDNKTILDKQLERINRDVTAFKGLIDMWDVINEVVIMPEFDKYDNAVTRICKEYGREKLVKEVFDAAKAANPDATLLINDFNLSNKYKELIDNLLNDGVPISAIGLQTHQHQGYMGKERLYEILERFESFNLPLHFTENTLISGQIMPSDIVDLNDYQVSEWPSTPEGEERQKNEWREMYEILFAHPLVEAITGWDFADGMWLNAPSGLIRKDNSLKPAYYELQKMIKEEWTSKGTLVTDENGFITLSGYRGQYELICSELKGEAVLSKKAGDVIVTLS